MSTFPNDGLSLQKLHNSQPALTSEDDRHVATKMYHDDKKRPDVVQSKLGKAIISGTFVSCSILQSYISKIVILGCSGGWWPLWLYYGPSNILVTQKLKKKIQKLSTVTLRAADFKRQKKSNRRTRVAPQIRLLVVGFSLRKTGFDPGEVQVGSAVGKLTPVQFFSRHFGILLSHIIPPMIRIHSSIIRWVDLRSKTLSPHPTNKTTQRPDVRPFGNHNVRTTTN